MEDGSKQNQGINLSVYAFTPPSLGLLCCYAPEAAEQTDVELLITALNERYNIKCSIHATEKGPRIYVNKKKYGNFKTFSLSYASPRAFNEI